MIGIGLSSDRLRALAFEHGRIIWCAQTAFGPDISLLDALTELTSSWPLRKWCWRHGRRNKVAIAIGPTMSHFRLLRGLPPMNHALRLPVVQESASRFFPVDHGSLVVTGIQEVDETSAWASAIPAELIAEIKRACAALKWRCEAIVPTLALLPSCSADEELQWVDGPMFVRVLRTKLGIQSIERRRRSTTEQPVICDSAAVLAPLETLGQGAWGFADAFGAATVRRDQPFVLRIKGTDRDQSPIPTWRFSAACVSW